MACGRRLRLLNVIDDHSRERLACIVDISLSGRRVMRELTAIVERRGLPCMVVSNNGTELTDMRRPRLVPGHPCRVALHRSGQAAVEWPRGSFNGRLRDECLNEHLFPSLAAAKRVIEAWRTDYNTVRPHSSLSGVAPAEFTNRPSHGHEDTKAELAAA